MSVHRRVGGIVLNLVNQSRAKKYGPTTITGIVITQNITGPRPDEAPNVTISGSRKKFVVIRT